MESFIISKSANLTLRMDGPFAYDSCKDLYFENHSFSTFINTKPNKHNMCLLDKIK